MLTHLGFLGFAVLTPTCGFIQNVPRASKRVSRAASSSHNQADVPSARVVVRSLPWTIEVPELCEQLNRSISALYGPLSSAPEVITPQGGSKQLSNGRTKWHTGTAFLTFVSPSAADAAAKDLTGGIVLKGCGTRLIYGALVEAAPHLAPCMVSNQQDTQGAALEKDSDIASKSRAPTPQTELARRRHHRLSRRRRELESLDAVMAAVTLPESLGGVGATLDACRVPLVAPALDWDTDTLRAVDPCTAVPGILSPRVPRKQVLVEGSTASSPDNTPLLSSSSQQQQRQHARSSRKAAIRMAAGTARGGRKREQVEAFACALRAFDLPEGSTVVDCGSGSGHLTLPLAALFPELQIVALDFKEGSVNRLAQRAVAAGLTNVVTIAGRIEDYRGPCAAVVALHACGSASDAALQLATSSKAPFAVSPCCVGKLQLNNPGVSTAPDRSATSGADDTAAATTTAAAASTRLSTDNTKALLETSSTSALSETYELEAKSDWLRRQLPLGAFGLIAKAADNPAAFPESSSSVIDSSSSSSSRILNQELKSNLDGAVAESEALARAAWERCRRSKALVELDRLMAAQERRGGALGTLYAVHGEHMGMYPKNDLLTSCAVVFNG